MIMSEDEMDEQIELHRQMVEEMTAELYDDEPRERTPYPHKDCDDIKYVVVRNKGNVIISIMFNRSNNKYHFVNLTKGHICACAFDTVDDAINDMKYLKDKGEIIDYFKL